MTEVLQGKRIRLVDGQWWVHKRHGLRIIVFLMETRVEWLVYTEMGHRMLDRHYENYLRLWLLSEGYERE